MEENEIGKRLLSGTRRTWRNGGKGKKGTKEREKG